MEAVGVQRRRPSNAVFQRSSHCALFVAGGLAGDTGAEWRDQRKTPFTVDYTSAGYTEGVTQTATWRDTRTRTTDFLSLYEEFAFSSFDLA